MTTKLTLESRIHGALLGAAIGAELGFARCVEPHRFAAETAEQLLALDFSPAINYQPQPHNTTVANARSLVDIGVRSYVKAEGRATPEVFGKLFKDDDGVATPAFWWDGLHTVQEMLKEGMNPRISGLGTHPSGLICAAMPAVGIYHFAHPEYAYLDGVELASVAQNRNGADWAGLCAAAIAAAFNAADGNAINETILSIAFDNNRKLFYELNPAVRNAARGSDKDFIRNWLANGDGVEQNDATNWPAYNPIRRVVQVLGRFADRPKELMALLVAPPCNWYGQSMAPIIGGAIAGAMHGPDAFPKAWHEWAQPIAKPWFAMAGIIEKRTRVETRIIESTSRLAEPDHDGSSLLEDKVRGGILAGAIGNAMGSPVEGRMYWDIDKQYPGGVTTVLDPSRLEGEDDNQMAMLLVETYLAREGRPVMARHFGKTWEERLNRQHFFPGCMGNSYDLIQQGWDPRVIGHWAVVTGSTVMCMEPVGMYHALDREFAMIDAAAVSYMYQRGLDVAAAVMLCATVAEAFNPKATVESVCNAAIKAAPTEQFRTFDQRRFKNCREYLLTCLDVADKYNDVMKVRKELYDKCLFYHMIDPLELWGLTLAMLKVADGDVRQAAIGGTNIGRDSDTIAGRGAMLAGILRGSGNVPQEWIEMFSAGGLNRIRTNSKRLADLIAGRKLDMLKARQDVS